jgi:sulfide:quinone oxidoreductase
MTGLLDYYIERMEMRRMSHEAHYKIVIVGGGSGGITVAAQLLRESRIFRGDIAIIDPATKHYYQPLWTLVGGRP